MAGAATLTAWLWDDRTPRPGWAQMALDRALADRAAADGTTVYRLYRWERDTLSFGANEAATRTWDRRAIEQAGLSAVRRPTGGRGVWHDTADLTYAVTAPLGASFGLRLAYRVIHEQLASALVRLGLPATVAPAKGRPTLDPGACFDLAVGGEVMVAGRKSIGSAQAVIGSALLQHGAIARADRQAPLARFRLDQPPMPVHRPPVPWPEPDAVADDIVGVWREAGAKLAPADVICEALEASTSLSPRFRDPAWTWRR